MPKRTLSRRGFVRDTTAALARAFAVFSVVRGATARNIRALAAERAGDGNVIWLFDRYGRLIQEVNLGERPTWQTTYYGC